MSNCLNEMEATSTGSVISLIELKKCKGYQALSQAVAKDIAHNPKDTSYAKKLNWIIERVLHYSEKLNLSASELLDKWEEKRSYCYMNYYQDYNMPKIEGNNIFIFETVDDFLKSIPSKKFLCPYCEGITTNPYECNSSKMKRTIIFIIIIYAVLVGIIIINAFPMNISGLLLSGFSLIALLLLKRKIKTNYLEKELEKYFYNKGYKNSQKKG